MKKGLNKKERSTALIEQNGEVQKNKTLFGFKKSIAIPVLILIAVLVLSSAGAAAYNIIINVDKTDYSFVDDQQVIGKWQAVDFVEKIDQFTPDIKHWQGELYLNDMVFIPGGKILDSFENSNLAPSFKCTWTKGLVIDKPDSTASKYDIREIKDQTYMFYEWKSGDYIYKNEKPRYYVLKKVDSLDYSGFEPTVIKDKIDYPFMEDPQVLGKWETVDFVKEIESFDPDKKRLEAEPYLQNFEFLDSGVMFGTVQGGSNISSDISWTKGLVLNPYNVTASKYIIKEVNGSMYMFFEWKSGDYTFRGMKPQYYVLKKVG